MSSPQRNTCDYQAGNGRDGERCGHWFPLAEGVISAVFPPRGVAKPAVISLTGRGIQLSPRRVSRIKPAGAFFEKATSAREPKWLNQPPGRTRENSTPGSTAWWPYADAKAQGPHVRALTLPPRFSFGLLPIAPPCQAEPSVKLRTRPARRIVTTSATASSAKSSAGVVISCHRYGPGG